MKRRKKLDIDKAELQTRFIKGDTKYLLKKTYEIAAFIVNNSQSGIFIQDRDYREDMVQECVAHFYFNYKNGKIDPSKNIFSLIWISSKRKILEHLRTKTRRTKIRNFESLDFQLEEFKIDSDTSSQDFLIDKSNMVDDFVSFTLNDKVVTISKDKFRDKKTLKRELINKGISI